MALSPFHNLLPPSLQLLLLWSKFHLTQSLNWNMPNSRRTLPWLGFPLKRSFCLQPCATLYSARSLCCVCRGWAGKATRMICNEFSRTRLCQGSSSTTQHCRTSSGSQQSRMRQHGLITLLQKDHSRAQNSLRCHDSVPAQQGYFLPFLFQSPLEISALYLKS